MKGTASIGSAASLGKCFEAGAHVFGTSRGLDSGCRMDRGSCRPLALHHQHDLADVIGVVDAGVRGAAAVSAKVESISA